MSISENGRKARGCEPSLRGSREVWRENEKHGKRFSLQRSRQTLSPQADVARRTVPRSDAASACFLLGKVLCQEWRVTTECFERPSRRQRPAVTETAEAPSISVGCDRLAFFQRGNVLANLRNKTRPKLSQTAYPATAPSVFLASSFFLPLSISSFCLSSPAVSLGLFLVLCPFLQIPRETAADIVPPEAVGKAAFHGRLKTRSRRATTRQGFLVESSPRFAFQSKIPNPGRGSVPELHRPLPAQRLLCIHAGQFCSRHTRLSPPALPSFFGNPRCVSEDPFCFRDRRGILSRPTSSVPRLPFSPHSAECRCVTSESGLPARGCGVVFRHMPAESLSAPARAAKKSVS